MGPVFWCEILQHQVWAQDLQPSAPSKLGSNPPTPTTRVCMILLLNTMYSLISDGMKNCSTYEYLSCSRGKPFIFQRTTYLCVYCFIIKIFLLLSHTVFINFVCTNLVPTCIFSPFLHGCVESHHFLSSPWWTFYEN